jgi:hypothetical protein
MSQQDQNRTPQAGETLILSDGRHFRVSSAEVGVRGWWFSATAQDGSSVLQGNLELEWDARGCVWRPHPSPSPSSRPQGALTSEAAGVSLPPSMRSISSPKRKQLD